MRQYEILEYKHKNQKWAQTNFNEKVASVMQKRKTHIKNIGIFEQNIDFFNGLEKILIWFNSKLTIIIY